MVVMAMAFGVYHKNMLRKGGLLAPLLTHGDDAGIGMAVGLAARWLQPILSSVRLSLASTARRYPEKPGGFFNLAGQLHKTCSLYLFIRFLDHVPSSMMFHNVPWPIYANLTRGQAANHASACSWGAQGFLHPSTCWVLVLGIILSTLLRQNRSSKCLLNLHLLSQPPEHIRLLATFSGYIIPAQMDPNDRIGQTTCDSSWAVPNSSKFFRDLGGNLSAFTILYDVSRIRGGASLDWYWRSPT